MEERTKIHVGLDVHKDSISVAAAELGRAPARLIGKLTHDLNKLLKVLTKIGTAEALHIVYSWGISAWFLRSARVASANDAAAQTRMTALARQLGWLSPEFLRMIADRMARDRLGQAEIVLVCSTARDCDPGEVGQLLALGTTQPAELTHAAVLSCLGSAESHQRTVRALISPRDEDAAIAQLYLHHRPLADAEEVRAVTTSIARMSVGGAQVRALETLARRRLSDAQSLQEIARLFPQTRSLDVQRAIACILIRSDTRLLPRDELARKLRQHRLKSPDGNDVIDMLIRLPQSA